MARFLRFGAAVSVLLLCGALAIPAKAALPDPAADTPLAGAAHTEAKVVLAGGCFWGMQAVFEHVRGVTRVTAGYAGGSASDAHYDIVSSGTTGHAESVEVDYDPAQISYGQLLKIYFGVAHDPTELNRQGPDEGTQYRSEIFYTTPDQRQIAQAYIAQLQSGHVFPGKIETAIAPLGAFYPAESYHQDYAALHPDDAYIAANDTPKLSALKAAFPNLYKD